MKDNIIVLENVYNKETYNSLFAALHEHEFSYFFGDSNGRFYWTSPLEKPSLVKDLCDKMLEEFSNKFSNIGQVHRMYINSQTYGLEPGPHYDAHYNDSVTVINYITDTWNITWGGETFLYDKYAYTIPEMKLDHVQTLLFDPISVDAVITPAYNRTLIFPGNQLHCVKPLSRYFAGARYTFMYKINGITVDKLMKGYNDN